MPETYYVYILASTFQKLYTGVTNNLPDRVRQTQNLGQSKLLHHPL
jgi:predicted GIY-YIG superfamily endonuclease